MQNISNKLMNFLFALIVLLIFVGGYVIKTDFFKVEIASVDAWGIFLLLITSLYYMVKKSKPEYFKKIEVFIEISDKKKFFYFLSFFFASILISHIFKFLTFNTDGADQAFVHQAILHSFESPILKCDVCNHGSYMGEHTSPILMLIGPILNLFKSHITLYLLELLIVFLGLYLLISSVLKSKEKMWLIAFIIIFSNRSLRQSLIWDFREDHLSFLALCISLWGLYRGKLITFLLSFMAILISKEHLAYFLPFLSFPIYFETSLDLTKKQRVYLSLFTIISSILWLVINSKVIVPYYNGGHPPTNHIVGRFPGYGSTNSEVVKNILFNPIYWLKLLTERVLTKGGIKYTLLFLAPYALLIFKRWWWLLAASPLFAMNLLSYAGTQRMMIFHYDLPILPLLIFSLLLTIKDMDRKSLVIPLLIAICISGRWPNYYNFKYFPSVNDIKDRTFFTNLDPNKIYATSMRLAANTSFHEQLRVFKVTHNQDSFSHFLLSNSVDQKAPAYNINDSTGIIFDLHKPNEKYLYNLATKDNWETVKFSSSKRFVLIEEEK